MLSEEKRALVYAEVDRLQDELIQVICDTVKIPSITPGFTGGDETHGETRVNEYMKAVMEKAGLQTDLWEEEPGRANLVGIWKGQGGGRSLLFNGHVDVVPAGDLDEWKGEDPFGARVADGKIFGRGTADMKAGNAAAVFAMKALLNLGIKPAGTVYFQNVVGEEMMNTEAGTGAAIKRGYTADAGIVVEPTTYMGRLNVCPASPGVADLVCTVRGKPVHSCMRDEMSRAGGLGSKVGVHAIDKGFLIYQCMRKLEEEWGQTKSHPLFTRPGHFTVSVGKVTGGVGGAIIPKEMVLECSFWHTPQEKFEDLQREVKAELDRWVALDPWLRENPPSAEWVFRWPAYDLPAEAPICQVCSGAGRAVNPECGSLYGFPAVNDAAFLNAAGIPTVAMGPGELRLAHGAGEYVPIQDILDAAKIYALAIAEWCGV